jgi:hypothetical protein
MKINYTSIQSKVKGILKDVGLPVTIERDGAKLTSGYGVMVGSEAEDDSTGRPAVLAQTSLKNRKLLIDGLAKEPLVGDVVTYNKEIMTITLVERIKPAATTVLYKVDVV